MTQCMSIMYVETNDKVWEWWLSYLRWCFCQIRRMFPPCLLKERDDNNGNIFGPIFHFIVENIVTIPFLTGYMAFEITWRWYGHAESSYAHSLCVAVFCSILLQANSDHIRKSYFTGVKEIMPLPPYHWINTMKNKINRITNTNKANYTICIHVSYCRTWWYNVTDSSALYGLDAYTLPGCATIFMDYFLGFSGGVSFRDKE